MTEWRIRPTFLADLSREGVVAPEDVRTRLLDADLREIGVGSFSDELSRGKEGPVHESLVLQVVSVRDVAQPVQADADEHRKRALLLYLLTDGRKTVRCLDLKGTASLPRNTVPGTKVLLKSGTVRKGTVLLDAGSLEVLGGRVAELAEAWEFQQRFGKIRPKAVEEDEAPHFEHYDPRRPRANISLGTFNTDDILKRSVEGSAGDSAAASVRRSLPSNSAQIFQNRDFVQDKLSAEVEERASTSSGPSRGRRGRGRGRGRRSEASETSQTHTLTLEEYEAARQPVQSLARDAALAEQLQAELNTSGQSTEQDLVTAMFSYTPKQDPPTKSSHRGRGRRGRRGRGRR